MGKYTNEDQAAGDGYTIVHEPDAHRYALYQAGMTGQTLVGEAHYSLRGDDLIDFDHTEVHESLRGTGLAGLLAERAVTGDAVEGRRIVASCWYIAGYLERHPEATRS